MLDKFHDLRRHFMRPPRWSTLWAVIGWGVAGFMAFPSWPSYLDHFIMYPTIALITLWQAHREGRQEATREHIQSSRE
jgi:hypothetical protein